MSLQSLIKEWEENANILSDKVCVHYLDTSYTWSDIKALVEQYKSKIDKLSLSPGCRIAINMCASHKWIAWVWACWSRGITYCPIVPSLASERIKYQLDIGQFHALVQEDDLLSLYPNAFKSDPNGAYLVFTSGSSGRPKGVLVGWYGIKRVWIEQQKLFNTNTSSRFAWMLSPAFDASMSDVGVSLFSGSSIYILPSNMLRYNAWRNYMEKHKITHIDAPPSWLSLFYKKDPPKYLQTIIAGGEPTPLNILKAWSGKLRWVNVYGPTENTICTSAQIRRLDNKDILDEDFTNTLGQPFEGVFYKIVDPQTNQECDEGELWIGGDCTAIGYWLDDKLSSKAFVYMDGRKWFKTKDWVRVLYTLDNQNKNKNTNVGNIDISNTQDNFKEWIYLGRMDRQIKKNGQLIHLDEIERVLSQFKDINQIAIIANEEKQIISFFTQDIDINELKSWASQYLPKWGIPNRWIKIDRWPLNSNDKIDRKSLLKYITK